MAKPIFVLRVDTPLDSLNEIREGLENQLTDYHILILVDEFYKLPIIECYNDCKGLPDIDIEKLINDFNK